MRIVVSSFFLIFLFAVTGRNNVFAQEKQPVIVFASDTQEPMWVEKFFHKTDHNPEATKMIFKDLETIRPEAFFILGDVVSLGKSKSATLGNHEVMFNKKKGTRNYRNELHILDTSSTIKSIIVGCHHSPYTNSKTVKPSSAVQQNFVQPYIQSKKCLLFLSGHSHNFERFQVQGKYFLNIAQP